jgi:hypothetical protein
MLNFSWCAIVQTAPSRSRIVVMKELAVLHGCSPVRVGSTLQPTRSNRNADVMDFKFNELAA